MKNYIFITSEGHTYQPGSENNEPDIENLQVIGFAGGESPEEAARNLLKESKYISDTTFNEVTAMELKSGKGTFHCLKKVQLGSTKAGGYRNQEKP